MLNGKAKVIDGTGELSEVTRKISDLVAEVQSVVSDQIHLFSELNDFEMVKVAVDD